MQQRQGVGMGGMIGGLAGGAILGYLLSRSMISPSQFNDWRNLDQNQLSKTLTSQGIVDPGEFIALEQQASSGALNSYLPLEDQQYLQSVNNAVPADNNYSSGHDDSSDDSGSFGGGDFGGSDT